MAHWWAARKESAIYAGQAWKVTVFDAEKGVRVLVAWSDRRASIKALMAHEHEPAFIDARNEMVKDRETGDI